MSSGQNWLKKFFYIDPDDKRIWVPKKYGLGWTINFGNPKANLHLFLITNVVFLLSIAVLLAVNYRYISENPNILLWYIFSLLGAALVFHLNFTRCYLSPETLYTALSFGVLSCLIGFGLQGIFNGIPSIIISKAGGIKWYHHLYFGPVAGLCQTLGKLLIIMLLFEIYKPNTDAAKTGLTVGLGFTAAEISFIFISVIAQKSPHISLIGVWERISASVFHIYSTGLLAKGFSENTKKYFILVVIVHGIMDFLAGAYSSFGISVFTVEVIVTSISILVWIYFIYIVKKQNDKAGYKLIS